MVSNQPRWWAFGFVIGDRLPELEPFRIGTAKISRWADPYLADARSRPRLMQHASGIPWGYQLIPPHVWVHSDWIIEWQFNAANFQAAENHVKTELVPTALGSLTTFGRYKIELCRITEVENGKLAEHVQSFFPLDAICGLTEIRPLTANDRTLLEYRHAVLSTDETARQASRYFLSASVAALYARSDPFVGIAPLMGFHLCIEAVVSEVGGMANDKRPEDFRRNQAAIVEAMKTGLASATGTRKKVGLVFKAKEELDRIAHARYRDQIREAARLIDLEDSVVTKLDAFYKVRNDYLGHPNEHLEPDELLHWLTESEDLARLVLARYIDWRSGHDPIATDAPDPLSSPNLTAEITYTGARILA